MSGSAHWLRPTSADEEVSLTRHRTVRCLEVPLTATTRAGRCNLKKIQDWTLAGIGTIVLYCGSARNETVWQPEPQNRGTYGLLSTCTITMILCVWTAVHLNLPEHLGRGHGIAYLPPYQTLRKMWWLLLGLFAPELVPWTAFEQHQEALSLQ